MFFSIEKNTQNTFLSSTLCMSGGVCSGSYDIYVGGKRLGSYNDSGFFGELALMYNQPRAATIIAAMPGSLWAMVSSDVKYTSSVDLFDLFVYLRQRRRYMFLPVFVCQSVCVSVCLLERLLKNACMDLDEMLRVDRCRDVDELINF